MSKTENLKQARQQAVDERGFSVWLVWAVLLVVGALGWAWLGYQVNQNDASLGKTEAAASKLQSEVAMMNAEAVLAASGNAGSLDRMTHMHDQIQTDVALLQRGGYLFPDDTTPVLALTGVPSIPLGLLNGQLAEFDKATQILVGSSESLRSAADAQTQLPTTIAQIKETSAVLDQIKNFTTGNWSAALRPIRQDITGNDMESMPVIFAANTNNQVLAKQWSDVFVARANQLAQLAQIAQKDGSLTSRDKGLIKQWAEQANTLAMQTQTLLASAPARQAALKSLEGIRTSAASLQAAVDNFARAVHQLSKQASTTRYILWGAIALTWIGLLGCLRAMWILGYDRWKSGQDGQKGLVLMAAVDKASRDLRKILSRETTNDRLNIPADSPIFALGSMINQALSLKDQAALIIEEQGRDLQQVIFDIDGMSASSINSINPQRTTSSLIKNLSEAEMDRNAATVAAIQSLLEGLDKALENSHHGGGAAHENSWAMEAIRENTQSTSKRIKRLGEGAQAIGVSSDLIKEISKKIKVLALNVAVEAAAHGEHGRNFSVLARELERLAQNADQAVKDIDTQISTIQTDAKDTVASMENGTGDVVKSTQLSATAFSMFRELAQLLEKSKGDLEGLYPIMNESRETFIKEIELSSSLIEAMNEQENGLRQIRGKNDRIRNTLEVMRKWLASSGRDI